MHITCCIGVRVLKELPKDCERAVILGEYILENKSTVRACAKQFGISKSTVHKDVSQRLPKIHVITSYSIHYTKLYDVEYILIIPEGYGNAFLNGDKKDRNNFV